MPTSRRRGRPTDFPFLCSGMDSPVRCSACGGRLTASAHQRGAVYDDGEIRHHYRSHRPSGGCGRTIADQRVLDSIIESMTLHRLSRPDQIAAMQDERRAERKPLEEEVRRCEALRPYWDRHLNEGLMTMAQHAAAVDPLDAGIRKAREALARLEAVPVPDLDDATIRLIADGWSAAAPETRRRDLRRVWMGYRILVAPGPSTDDEVAVRERVLPPMRIRAAPR